MEIDERISLEVEDINIGNENLWKVNTNFLCNYMQKPEYLQLIIRNRAIIPRYVIESIDYLGLNDFNADKICIPMTCFCDIPFNKAKYHMGRYGRYGICFDKLSLLRNHGVQPIMYVNDISPYADDLREVIRIAKSERLRGKSEKLADFLLTILIYTKPILKYEIETVKNPKAYVFQDECEWRFVPTKNFPSTLPLVLPLKHATESGINYYSNALKKHPGCWLRFEWQDVKYLIVEDEKSKDDLIDTISSLDIEEKEKYKLITSIIIASKIDDFS